MEINVDQLQAQIQLAVMLIQLGVTTVEKVKSFFADNGHDDQILAEIMAEVDQRIARRNVPPPAA